MAVTMAVTMISPSSWLILWRWGSSSVAPRILCASNAPQRSSARAKHCSVEDLDGWRVVKCTSHTQSIDVNHIQCRYRRYLGCFQVYVFFLSQKIIPINIVRICSTSPVLEDLTKTTSHHCHQEITTPTVLALLPHRFPSSSYFHIIYI